MCQGERDVCLHRALADAELLGNVSVAHALFSAHKEDTAALLGHLRYLAHHHAVQLVVAHLGVALRIARSLIRHFVQSVMAERLLDVTKRSVTCRNKKITIQILYLRKAFPLYPKRHKEVLHDVFGILTVGTEVHHKAKNLRIIPHEKGVKSLVASQRKGRQQ